MARPDQSSRIRLLLRILVGLVAVGAATAGALIWLAGSATSIPAESRSRTLVRLGGLPEAVSDASRLRVLVADAALATGSRPDAPRWMDSYAYSDQMNTLAREVAMYHPDIAVIYNVIFSGDHAHHVAGGEFFAVEADMPWRVEVNQWNQRFAATPLLSPSEWPGEIVAGTLILSRFPVERHTAELGAPTEGPSRSASVRAILNTGPTQETIVEVFDGELSSSGLADPGPHVVQIARDQTGQFTIGETETSVATEYLSVRWGEPGARLQSQNSTRFHDNLDREILMAEFRWAAPQAPQTVEGSGETEASGDH